MFPCSWFWQARVIASFVLLNLLGTKGNKCYSQLSQVRMHSIRQRVSPWAVKQNIFTHILTHSCVLTRSMDQLWLLTRVSSRMSTEENSGSFQPQPENSIQWLLWLLNFVFGKENKNLLCYRRSSILKWFNILSSNIWSHSAELDLLISPFCELFLHLPKPVYCLFPGALQEAQINKFFKKPEKAESHKNKPSVQHRKAGFVTCSMWGGTSNADNLKLIKGKGT